MVTGTYRLRSPFFSVAAQRTDVTTASTTRPATSTSQATGVRSEDLPDGSPFRFRRGVCLQEALGGRTAIPNVRQMVRPPRFGGEKKPGGNQQRHHA